MISYGQLDIECPKIGLACKGGTHKGNGPVVTLDGSGTLGQIYNNSACGLNYVSGSVLIEQRSAGFGFNTNGTGLPSSITISGLPPCYIIDKAYLWIAASYSTPSGFPPNVNLSITNPSSVLNSYSMTLAGDDGDKCWGEDGTATYRADVTANISGNGVYSFNVTGFSDGDNEIDGATLIVIYRNPGVTYQGSLIIYDGAETAGTFNSYPAIMGTTISGFSACANSTYANAFLVVADMQANVNGGVHATTLNGSTSFYSNNFYNFDVTNTSVFAGQTTSTFYTDGQGVDCFEVLIEGLYYQTTTCVTCTPASALTLATAPTATSCNLCNGSATVTASGGTGPYTYLWSSSGQTKQTASGLCAGNYTVTVSDNSGCNTSTASVTISTSNAVASSIPSSTNVKCNGQCNGAASGSATGGTLPYSYSWSSGQSTISVSGLCSGTFNISITDSNNCTSVSTVVITQPVTLAASVGQSNVLCSGSNNGTATVTASGGTAVYSYLWNNGQSTSTSSGLTAGTYSVTVTDANGCTKTSNVTITSTPLPTINVSTSQNLCSGLSTSLTAGGGLTYVWSPSTGLSSSSGSSVTANPTASTTYNVTGTDANGCTNTAVTTVIVNPLPVITASPSSTLCIGQAAMLTAAGGSTYVWSPATGLSSTSGSSVTANPTSTTIYTVTGTDANGCTGTKTITITVNPLPSVSASPAASTFCSGQSLVLTASGGSTYTWSPASGLSSTSGTTVTANATISTTYTVTGTDANGCTNYSTVILTVNPLPVASVSTPAPICKGSSASITASGGTSYSWSPSTGLSSTSSSVVTANPTTTTTYTVVVGNVSGCTISTTTTVTVNPVPAVPSIGPCLSTQPVWLCTGSTASVTANVTGGTTPYSYTWSNGSTASGVSGLSGGTYAVTVSDANGCTATATKQVSNVGISTVTIAPATVCNGTTVTLTSTVTPPSPAPSLIWNGPGVTNVIGSSLTVKPSTTSTYTISVINSGGGGCNIQRCTTFVNVTVTVNQLPAISINSSATTICNGQPVSLTANGGNIYTWSPPSGLSSTSGSTVTANPTTATTYTVTGTDLNGCKNTSTVSINTATYSASANATPVCAGTPVQLTASGGTTYQWSPTTGLSDSTISNPMASPTTTATYSVTIISGGCSSTIPVTVNVNPAPPTPAITRSNDTLYVSTNPGYTGYQWYYNGSLIPGATDTMLALTQNGSYTVIVTNMNGCTSVSNANSVGGLPIELLEFSAVAEENIVRLYWVTATEINNDYFTIEKSATNANFLELMRVPGAGNSNSIRGYSATDVKPYPGISYYRLKQTDYDGKFSYSKTAAVDMDKSMGGHVNVYPNPAEMQIGLYAKSLHGDKPITVTILNTVGEVIAEKNLMADGRIIINIKDLAAGMYFVKAYQQDGDILCTGRFVKK